MAHGPDLVPPRPKDLIIQASTLHAADRERAGALEDGVGLPEQMHEVPLEQWLERGDGRELLPAEPLARREDAPEQGEDVAPRARELPERVEAITYHRDATGDGVELSTWDHGMVPRGHALGQTGDEVTVARDHHERAAFAVPERQRYPRCALGQAELFEQRLDEDRVLVKR